MEVTMLLGAGQSTGCLSFQGLVLIAMLLACWVRVKVMHQLVLLLVLFRHMQVM
uniref:Uncharacterized protein n=1 Tax=Populus trichocarpa TaxID=3694 RepID=A9PGD1_POPTR|nr:unknown [Populus trichocarpa]